jgi:hypothetical protein
MVKIIVDGVVYTCLVFFFVCFLCVALFGMLMVRTAMADAEATSLRIACSGDAEVPPG